MDAEQDKKKIAPYKFNTFSGVFVPSVLAILGAVMYYIAPKIVGGVGLIWMFAIILLAHSITIATAFSISSIATNIRVKGGGLYYLISRSLGTEFGGSMGIQLFLAQTVAASFYIIAFSKAVSAVLGVFNIIFPELYIALASCLFFGILVFRGADFVIKMQYIILGVIVLSLASIFLGPNITTPTTTLMDTGAISIPFWIAFAMFFPAVTGIDAGVGMSGDLKDPKKSLVKGTFFSIMFTMAIYIALAVKLSFAATPEELVMNPYVIHGIALFSPVVILGVLLATASSALSCFMIAPRSLRAMAKDRIFSSKFAFLGNTIGRSNEPRIALLLTLIIAVGVIFLGSLDLVAQIVAILFLNVYGWINGAAFLEKISKNPSYRPSFNSPTIVHLYGMVACYAVMYLFNPLVMLIGIVFQISVFYLLLKTKRSAKIEGVWDGVLFQLLRKVLNKMEHGDKSRKNWRPTIVAFCASNANKKVMADILDWINSNRSITKMYFLVHGKLKDNKKRREELENEMKDYFKEKDMHLFSRVVVSDDFRTSLETLVESETIGNLSFNTAFLDFDERFKVQRIICDAVNMKKNMIILRNKSGFSGFRTVDVWWNTPSNGNFMILLAYLITHSKEWKEENAIIRLFKVVKNKEEYESEKVRLEHIVEQSRIENIEINIIRGKEEDMDKIIYENSKNTDLVIMGLPDTGNKRICPVITNELKKYTDNLKVSLIVLANDKIDFKIN